MKKLAIIGHPTRGKEVIEILKMLGGKNEDKDGCRWECKNPLLSYYVDDTGWIEFINTCNPNENILRYTLEEFLEKYPYKIGAKVTHSDYESLLEIVGMKWENDSIKYEVYTNDYGYWFSVDELQPYKKETTEEIKIDIPKGYKFAGVDNDNQKLVFTKIRPQYPKTYEECCEVLGIEEDLWFVYEDIDGNHINPACISNYRIRNLDLYHNFEKLRICRDAHWKIAGEQMGLGKSWEPDYSQSTDANAKYTITFAENEIYTDVSYIFYYFLIFPTEEIRDSFLENFKELIELCKKLL